jgi:hypothetical protein
MTLCHKPTHARQTSLRQADKPCRSHHPVWLEGPSLGSDRSVFSHGTYRLHRTVSLLTSILTNGHRSFHVNVPGEIWQAEGYNFQESGRSPESWSSRGLLEELRLVRHGCLLRRKRAGSQLNASYFQNSTARWQSMDPMRWLSAEVTGDF